MSKTFYTERDIEDLFRAGVTSLVVNDDVVVTDLGRERALKLGFELVREHDQPQAAPIRPYIAKDMTPKAPAPKISAPQPALIAPKITPPASKPDLELRVLQAVKAKVGGSVDEKLLATIIERVLKSVGGG